MAFNISVKVDSSQAEQQIGRLHAQLTKVEGTGPRAGKAIEGGLKAGELAAKQLQKGLDDIGKGNPFASLTAALEREQAMLERIQGPVRQMKQDLETLASLHRRGAINAEQYDEQLAKLEKRKAPEGGIVEGSLGGALAGRGGELGELGLGLSKGKIAAGAAVGVFAELTNEYTKMQQSALRLAPSIGAVDDTIAQQIALSKDLHASFEQTIELSIMVKERTAEMNMADHERLALTKALGEGALLSGRSMQEVAERFGRLAFAMENGLPPGREMRAMLRDYPALAEAVAASLHKPTAAILEMAKNNKISLDQMMSAWEKAGPELAEKAGKVPETLGQRWDHFKDSAASAVNKAVSVIKEVGAADLEAEVRNANKEAIERIEELNNTFANLERMVREHNEKILSDVRQTWTAIPGVFDKASIAMQNIGMRFGVLADPWANLRDPTSADEITRNARKIGAETAAGVGAAKLEIKALDEAFKAGGITVEAYRTKYRALLTTIEGGESMYRKVATEFADASREYSERLVALRALHDNGSISIDQYRFALSKLKRPLDEAREYTHKLAVEQMEIERRWDLFSFKVQQRGGAAPIRGNNESIQNAHDFLMFDQADTDFSETAAGKHEEERLAKQEADAKKMSDATRDFFDKNQKEMAKTAEESGKKMLGALEPVNNMLVDMVTKGKVDFKSMVDSMIADLIRLGLKMAEEKLLAEALDTSMNKGKNFLGHGGGGGGLGGLGSLISGAISAAPMFAAAHGGDFLVHAATGFSGTVPGYGGTDSRLFAAAVTPGEHIAIRTPQQMRDEQQPGAPSGTVVHVHNHMSNEQIVSAMNSRQGAQVVQNIIRIYAPQIRSFLGI